MPEHFVYIGSRGPYPYDPTEEYVPAAEEDLSPNPDDGDAPYSPADATLVRPIRASHPMYQDTAPDGSVPQEVANVEYATLVLKLALVSDINAPDLSALSGASNGALLVARQVSAGADQYTIYAWDTAIVGATNSPYIVAGDGGYWIAVGGKYSNMALTTIGGVNLNVGQKLVLDADAGGDSYFVYESGHVRLYVNGAAEQQWPS